MATDTIPHNSFDTILVLDFGSQYTHLITRRLREINVYSEMLPCTQKLADLGWKPKGIILSGGPYSVYEDGAPHADPAFFDLGVPILGICYGLQELAHRLHADNVVAGTAREYGHADLKATKFGGHVDKLFEGLEGDMTVWMSHGDKLRNLPEGFHTIGTTKNSEYAAIAHKSDPIYGIQFHPEVTHTPQGGQLLRNFAVGICGAEQKWTMAEFIGQEIARIRSLVGPDGQVLGAVSGGVDSTVAAKLMTEAIGDRFHAVLVDNGCMRLNECEKVQDVLEKQLGINLTVVDAGDEFLAGLKGEHDPEKKRKFIGGKFIDVFEDEAKKIEAKSSGKVEWFLQGTLYPDVIESISFKGPSQTIKTHHNVGGIAERLMRGHGLKLIEPLRELFKDEVRELGRQLGISPELVGRHPFPGMLPKSFLYLGSTNCYRPRSRHPRARRSHQREGRNGPQSRRHLHLHDPRSRSLRRHRPGLRCPRPLPRRRRHGRQARVRKYHPPPRHLHKGLHDRYPLPLRIRLPVQGINADRQRGSWCVQGLL
ncbi:Putative GMP synthase [Aspergillus calidoustus]|uniref:GMP synthase (glutamine-hydrolyzing) n=1 Tax=Aspergillus calidoustus TaxID=454130 RepID=A0A0U5GNB8_ASPCI|nr:Putative GMP synthase [Aspergillus calidoustus]